MPLSFSFQPYRVKVVLMLCVVILSGVYGVAQAQIPTDGYQILAQRRLSELEAQPGSSYGNRVAVSGNLAAVSAVSLDDIRGAVFLYTKSGASWTLQQKLTASDGFPNDSFGVPALEGDTLAVSATGANSAAGVIYIFTRSGNLWTQQAKLTPAGAAPGDRIGRTLILKKGTLIAGASSAEKDKGALYVWAGAGNTWTQQAKITHPDQSQNQLFAEVAALDGDTLVVGASERPPAGAAYVFERSGTQWAFKTRLTEEALPDGSQFGLNVALSGDRMLIGQYGSQVVLHYRRQPEGWTKALLIQGAAKGIGTVGFGNIVALDGTRAVVGDINCGCLFTFVLEQKGWKHLNQLRIPDVSINFPRRLAVSGSVIIASNGALRGDSHAPGVYTFELPTPTALSVPFVH